MGVATAHRASPVAPKAERQDGNKKEVKDVQAPGSICTSRHPAREAEIVSISGDLAPERIDTMQNQQPSPPVLPIWIVLGPDASYTVFSRLGPRHRKTHKYLPLIPQIRADLSSGSNL